MLKRLYTDNMKVIFAAIIWGSSGAFIKYLDLTPGLISFFRVALPVLFFGAWFVIRGERFFENGIKILLIASVINAVRLFFYFIGFLNAPIGNAVIILYTYPVLAVLFSHFFLKEPLPFMNVMLLTLAMAGVVLVFSDKPIHFDNEVFVGMAAMLLSAALNASMVVIFKHQSPKFSPPQIVFFQNLVGAVCFLPFLITGMDQLTVHKFSVASLYAVLVGVVGFWLFFYALKRVFASTASFLSYIEVVSGILFGIFLFNEVLTWNEIAGGSMIIGASVLLKK
ncbi:MAG: DMT family transporter [Bacteroidales bacterium]